MKNLEDFLDKTKEMAEKAEALLNEKAEKVKNSETYARFSEAVEEVGEYVEKKVDEWKEGEYPDKIEALRNKVEAKAEEIIDHAKAYGSLIAGDVEEVIDAAKGKRTPDETKK
ncbi:MAG: hypothetical protein LWW85_06270 [Marinilabiliales bacterium]|nr:hypothetical protein [Marinilabiliales bacterium]